MKIIILGFMICFQSFETGRAIRMASILHKDSVS